MVGSSTLRYSAVLVAVTSVSAQTWLNPVQDILLPASSSASNPLTLLGANSPWFAGPNVNGVSNEVPEGCIVEQASYTVRHGSRYPDSGAYAGWVTLYEKIQNATFTASGSLSFIDSWEPVLDNTVLEMSQESVTGYKESHDLGYTLRTRYPSLYSYGTPFTAWANLYPRVVQTARMFVRGYLGTTSDTLGQVITVNSTGSQQALADSLAPADLCPAFVDSSGGTYATTFDDVYLPPIAARLNKLIKGDLNLTASDVSNFPYLCGFESQITGYLSPWCGVFTDAELQAYEYRQDLRYYYGVGPGTSLGPLMMLPYLNHTVGLLKQGPGIQGTAANGSVFNVPNLLVAFLNDGQIAEYAAALGVQDGQSLPDDHINFDRTYVSSNFVSMRGTVALERLNCTVTTFASENNGYWSKYGKGKGKSNFKRHSKTATTTNDIYVRILLNDAVYPLPTCQNGPGKTCKLSEYAEFIENRYETSGNWSENCNVTNTDSPKVLLGASFFTDLTSSWLASVTP